MKLSDEKDAFYENGFPEEEPHSPARWPKVTVVLTVITVAAAVLILANLGGILAMIGAFAAELFTGFLLVAGLIIAILILLFNLTGRGRYRRW